jgi:hypothetical protein
MSDATDEALCGIPVQLRESDYERGYQRGRESAMAAGEVLQAALLEARAALRHASVNIAYTKSKAAADDIDRVLQALAATDRLKEK